MDFVLFGFFHCTYHRTIRSTACINLQLRLTFKVSLIHTTVDSTHLWHCCCCWLFSSPDLHRLSFRFCCKLATSIAYVILCSASIKYIVSDVQNEKKVEALDKLVFVESLPSKIERHTARLAELKFSSLLFEIRCNTFRRAEFNVN